MEKNIYLVPANSKKSMLHFSLFNNLDLWILGGGVGFTFGLLLMFNSYESTMLKFFCACPALLALLLVSPLPYYHNVRTLIGNIYTYYVRRKNYFWRGWCVKDEARKSEFEFGAKRK